MDNLTHSLVGWALAETGLKRRTRKGLAACVMAANMPDIDVFFGWAPWAPLAMHRGFTHGLVGGVLLMPPLLAALLWLLDRWQVRRGTVFPSGLDMHFGWSVALSYLGAVTHPLLDLQNTYAVQLLSPFSGGWFHTDGLFIVSPWLLAMLGAGIWWTRRGERIGRQATGKPAILALTGAAAFIALNIGISALARQALRTGAPYANPDRVFAGPEPLRFWRREVVWRERGAISTGFYDPMHNLSALQDFLPPVADRMAELSVRRAMRATPEVEDFLAWSQLPMARVERKGGFVRITFNDARFMSPRTRDSFTVSVTYPAAMGYRPPLTVSPASTVATAGR